MNRRTSLAPTPSPSSFSSRRLWGFRSRTTSDIGDARVTVVSAPPRVREDRESDAVTTSTAAAMTTAVEPDETEIKSTTWIATTTSDLWSVSAPPKITTHNNSVLKSDTKDKDKRNSPSEDYPQIEWVFFEDFEGPIPSEKSQPLKVLTFEANDTGDGTMDQYFDDTADTVSMLTLPVSIIIGALCLGNAGSHKSECNLKWVILFKVVRTFVQVKLYWLFGGHKI